MDVSKFKDGVLEVWRFIREPIVIVILFFGVTYYIAPIASSSVLHKLTHTAELLNTGSLRVFQLYGLDKILPAIGFFIILLLIQIVSEIVNLVSDFIPGHILVRPAAILSVYLGISRTHKSRYYPECFRDDSKELIERFPGATDVFRLWDAMVEFVGQMDSEKSDLARNVVYRQRQLNYYSRLFSNAKFFLALAVLSMVVEIFVYRSNILPVIEAFAVITVIVAAIIVVSLHRTIIAWTDVVFTTIDAALLRPIAAKEVLRPIVEHSIGHPPSLWKFELLPRTQPFGYLKFLWGIGRKNVPWIAILPPEATIIPGSRERGDGVTEADG